MKIIKISDHSIDLDLLNEYSIIFDIGGYLGDFSGYLLEYVKCNYYIYEPNYRLTQLKNRFKDNDKVKVIYKAISTTNEDRKLFLGMKMGPNWIKSTGSSFYKSHKSVKNRFIKVRCTTLKNEIKRFDIDTIDLIKINIEGEEKNIIYDLPLKNIKQISISFHDHCGIEGYTKDTVNDIRLFIKKNGFKEIIYDNYDTLFIREELLDK